jgi:CHAT domain-containing protein
MGEAAGDGPALAGLEALERLRARTLAFQLSLSARRSERASVADDEWQADRAQLDWIYRRTHRLLREDAEAPWPGGLETERLALEQRLLEQRRRARLGDVDLQAMTSSKGVDWGRLRAAFADGRALVAYGQLDDEIFAVTLSAGRFRIHRQLADAAGVRNATAALHLQLDTQRLGAGALERHRALLLQRTRQCLAKLYDLLWRPLEASIGDVAEVGIVPTAVLGALPFAALWDGQRYLVERHAPYLLATVAAATANPERSALERVVLAADTRRLAGTRREIEGLQDIWPNGSLLLGTAMSRDGLCAQAPTADLLHLACHGQFRADSPLFSALFLDDGAFTAFEIERLPLSRRPLVVLSACEGAVRDGARGDEALGLVRAFLVAGASRVLAGLWQVDDASTAAWMIDLHRELRAAAAGSAQSRPALSHLLASVQRNSIANDQHPYYWAAFVLHGGR